jgi:Ca2+-transporting ATPase
VKKIAAEELVPGDIVLLEAGDIIPADLRVLAASKLQTNESALTGESAPVEKNTEAVAENAAVSDRTCMLFSGTIVTRGSGEGVVVATGMDSALGEIATMVEGAGEANTPLEQRLAQLGQKLVWVTLGITAVTAGTGILAGRETALMIQTALALAVAAIPEGLPVVATLALARGMWRMARRNALVNRLSAVETLGATSVICTDKTGTLTEDRLTVVRYALPAGDIAVTFSEERAAFSRGEEPVDPEEDKPLLTILETGVLCNNAALGEDRSKTGGHTGDPLEIALLHAGAAAGITRTKLLESLPEEREEPFESEVMMMGTFHRQDGKFRVAVKGAAEAVLKASNQVLSGTGGKSMDERERGEWLKRNEGLAQEGLRVLAFAEKTSGSSTEAPFENLTFIGLAGLLDPPRPDVREAIEECQRAGIRVIMITGDQAATATSVARDVGVTGAGEEAKAMAGHELPDAEELPDGISARVRETAVFARVSPKQKLALIAAHQRAGAIVAMTGDGVNDAPALKKADIGIAMGQRGTEVARDAADMILKDDAFATIVHAVQQGRVIFDNIRRFVIYLMSCNVSEVLIVAGGTAAQMPLPVLPLQILFLNLVTDVFPALALGMGDGDRSVMQRPPREANEPVLSRRHWIAVVGYASTLTAAVMAAFLIALYGMRMSPDKAVTVSFLTLAFGQLWHVFNMRDSGSTLLRNDVVRNRYVWSATGICTLLLLAAVYIPLFSGVLKLSPPDMRGWLLVTGFSLVPLLAGQAVKCRRSKH